MGERAVEHGGDEKLGLQRIVKGREVFCLDDGVVHRGGHFEQGEDGSGDVYVGAMFQV